MGESVVSVGLRHVKVWRAESSPRSSPLKVRLEHDEKSMTPNAGPGPKTLNGRNCLLGTLLDATFTCVAAISDHQAIVCTAQGDVCLLDDTHKLQKISKVAKVPFSISAVYYQKIKSLIWVGGGRCYLKSFPVRLLTHSDPKKDVGRVQHDLGSVRPESRDGCSLVAIGAIRHSLVVIDSERHIGFRSIVNGSPSGKDQKTLPAHDRAVLGTCPLSRQSTWFNSDFLTYSANGVVLYWLNSGVCVGRCQISMDQSLASDTTDLNELKALAVSPLHDLLVTGDKKGVIRCVQTHIEERDRY